jgi:hypothetical protein
VTNSEDVRTGENLYDALQRDLEVIKSANPMSIETICRGLAEQDPSGKYSLLEKSAEEVMEIMDSQNIPTAAFPGLRAFFDQDTVYKDHEEVERWSVMTGEFLSELAETASARPREALIKLNLLGFKVNEDCSQVVLNPLISAMAKQGARKNVVVGEVVLPLRNPSAKVFSTSVFTENGEFYGGYLDYLQNDAVQEVLEVLQYEMIAKKSNLNFDLLAILGKQEFNVAGSQPPRYEALLEAERLSLIVGEIQEDKDFFKEVGRLASKAQDIYEKAYGGNDTLAAYFNIVQEMFGVLAEYDQENGIYTEDGELRNIAIRNLLRDLGLSVENGILSVDIKSLELMQRSNEPWKLVRNYIKQGLTRPIHEMDFISTREGFNEVYGESKRSVEEYIENCVRGLLYAITKGSKTPPLPEIDE